MSLIELEKKAIQRLQAFQPDDGYYLCYSGGKDSDTIRILAGLANVKHDIVYNHTSVDAPETVRYIRSIPHINVSIPRYADGTQKTMWNLIEKKKTPPTRIIRYCCAELKEGGGRGRLKVTGVRWAESRARAENSDIIKIIGSPKTNQRLADELKANYTVSKQQGLIMNMDNDNNRRMVEMCYRTSATLVNPIVDWTDSDVWDFLNHYGCKSNPLYQLGIKRVGCIGCPMAGNHRYTEFKLYPKYKQMYIKAFDRMLSNSPHKKDKDWNTGVDVFRWWMGENPNQLSFFEE